MGLNMEMQNVLHIWISLEICKKPICFISVNQVDEKFLQTHQTTSYLLFIIRSQEYIMGLEGHNPEFFASEKQIHSFLIIRDKYLNSLESLTGFDSIRVS